LDIVRGVLRSEDPARSSLVAERGASESRNRLSVVLLRRFSSLHLQPVATLPVELPEKGANGAARRHRLLITQTEEDAMFASIRRYTPKGPANTQNINDLKRRIEESFLPVVQDIRGFHSYGVVNCGKDVLSINIFEDQQGATESARRAQEFVNRDPLKDQLGKPEILEGEVLILKEAGVGVR
jgi:hypothetical protein